MFSYNDIYVILDGCRRIPYMDKVKKWFFEEEDEDDVFEEEPVVETQETSAAQKASLFEKAKSNRASEAISNLNANSNLVLFEPRSYSETQDIASYLKNKKAAVVNLHRLQKEQSKRVIDFLSGVIYAIEGDIQQIGPKIFLCTPKNISVAGSINLDDDESEVE